MECTLLQLPATHKGGGPEADNLDPPIVHLLWTNPLQNENQKEECFQYGSLGLIQSRKDVTV